MESESYLQGDAPLQLVFLCVPQTHLSVMTTGEEDVLRGVRRQTPHLIYMTLRHTVIKTSASCGVYQKYINGNQSHFELTGEAFAQFKFEYFLVYS